MNNLEIPAKWSPSSPGSASKTPWLPRGSSPRQPSLSLLVYHGTFCSSTKEKMQPHPLKDFEILSTLPAFLLNVNSAYWERTFFGEVKGQTASNLARGVPLSSNSGLADRTPARLEQGCPLSSLGDTASTVGKDGSECYPRENFYL